MEIDFNKIKLVIWDLDNTFWQGIISETEIIPIEKNIQLVRDLTDCGIINSICSKNSLENCVNKLKELGVLEYFVFPSVDWTSKGPRVKNLISNMSLRPDNVLFIDDDLTNLNEAKHYSETLMIAEPSIIDNLINFISGNLKTDTEHKRLNQYKLLEIKNTEQGKFESNIDFLFSSNIKLVIEHNCKPEAERIHELILRSNQLNYTKKRIEYDELVKVFDDKSYNCGYIEVNDKFGNYGIVGFYALKDNELEHFLFSCRTIGLGVEQYVYSILGCPNLKIYGEVVSLVEKKEAPLWINSGKNENVEFADDNSIDSNKLKVLVKGPCDLSKSMTYIKNSNKFSYEFTYVEDVKARIIEAHNHSVHIIGLNEYNSQEKQQIVNDCIFVDPEMLNGRMFKESYNVIILSTLIESNYGIYQKKGTKLQVAFGSYMFPITDPQYWNDYITGKYYTGNNNFTLDYLKEFSKNYEFIGKTKPEDYEERIRKILTFLDNKTTLCLILGVEFPCEKFMENDFKERHLSHKELNNKIRKLAKSTNRLKLIDLNEIVKNQDDFTNNINHFTSRIYYEIALKITGILKEDTGESFKNYSKLYIYVDTFLNYVKVVLKHILRNNDLIISVLMRAYKFIGRKKN